MKVVDASGVATSSKQKEAVEADKNPPTVTAKTPS